LCPDEPDLQGIQEFFGAGLTKFSIIEFRRRWLWLKKDCREGKIALKQGLTLPETAPCWSIEGDFNLNEENAFFFLTVRGVEPNLRPVAQVNDTQLTRVTATLISNLHSELIK